MRLLTKVSSVCGAWSRQEGKVSWRPLGSKFTLGGGNVYPSFLSGTAIASPWSGFVSGELGLSTFVGGEGSKIGLDRNVSYTSFAAWVLVAVACSQGNCVFLLLILESSSGSWEGSIFCSLTRSPVVSMGLLSTARNSYGLSS